MFSRLCSYLHYAKITTFCELCAVVASTCHFFYAYPFLIYKFFMNLDVPFALLLYHGSYRVFPEGIQCWSMSPTMPPIEHITPAICECFPFKPILFVLIVMYPFR